MSFLVDSVNYFSNEFIESDNGAFGGLLNEAVQRISSRSFLGLSCLFFAGFVATRGAVSYCRSEYHRKRGYFIRYPEYFVYSITNGSLEEVRAFLREGVDINNWQDGQGRSPLIAALHYKQYEIANFLLEQPELDLAFNNQGSIALSVLSGTGFTETVDRLLSSNVVDVNYLRRGVITPIVKAASTGRTEIVRMLLRNPRFDFHAHGQGNKALNLAALFRHHQIVKLLIEDPRMRLDSRDEVGDSVLKRSINRILDKRHFGVIEMLLDRANLGDLLFFLKMTLDSNERVLGKLFLKRILAKHPENTFSVLCTRMGLNEEQKANLEIIFSEIQIYRRSLEVIGGRELPLPNAIAGHAAGFL